MTADCSYYQMGTKFVEIEIRKEKLKIIMWKLSPPHLSWWKQHISFPWHDSAWNLEDIENLKYHWSCMKKQLKKVNNFVNSRIEMLWNAGLRASWRLRENPHCSLWCILFDTGLLDNLLCWCAQVLAALRVLLLTL